MADLETFANLQTFADLQAKTRSAAAEIAEQLAPVIDRALAAAVDEALLPGYYTDPGGSGAWCSLPWPGDPSLPYLDESRLELLPASLGWDVIAWCERVLVHHLWGTPWRFTPGQKRFLILWFAVGPDGRWLYRSGVKRGAKGTGKDPFGAALCLAEFAGPVELAGWRDGEPVGRARRLPLVQIAANSEDQAKDLLRVANAMLPKEIRADLGIDCGDKRTIRSGGGRIEVLTASQRSSEGDPATFILLNESHHMTESSGGHAIAAVARRNVGKSPAAIQARLLEETNAHQMGADSVAEQSFEAWQAQEAGQTRNRDILYDSIEAPPTTKLHDDASRMAGLAAAYMDAPWADLERTSAEALDPRTSVADSIRYYLNGLAAAEDAWIDPRRFDACARADLVVADRERIALFLDCSKSEDATGLVGSRLSDGHVFVLGLWQRPHGDRGKGWIVPRTDVDASVRAAFERFDVVWFGVDPSPAKDDEDEALYWGDLVDAFHRDFSKKLKVWATPGQQGNSVRFDMRLSQRGGHDRLRAFTAAAEQTAHDIDEETGALTHDGHPALRQHVHHAKKRANQWGTSLGKVTRDSSDLVDLAVCMVGARMGRRLALNSGKVRARSTRSKVVVLS